MENVLSHSCFVLSATRLVPEHTPTLLTETQLPLLENVPLAQMIQLFEVPPLHVWHADEHTEQEAPLAKLPSGQTWFDVVMDGAGSHFVLSIESCVKPDAHEVH